MQRNIKKQIGRVTCTLGKAAVLNGPAGVDRAAAACFQRVFADNPDAETTRTVIELFPKIRAKAEQRGRIIHKVGNKDARVKIRWTDEFIARFRREAPKFPNSHKGNRAFARHLGLPSYCSDALRLGRKRFPGGGPATVKVSEGAENESLGARPHLAA